MKCCINHYFVFMFLSIGFTFSGMMFAQTSNQDSVEHNEQEQVLQQDMIGDEMVLDVIEIQGKIDRPGVIIVPKRVEPEMEEIELERSFQQEVKEEAGQIPEPQRELQQVDRIESIKKTIQKERE